MIDKFYLFISMGMKTLSSEIQKEMNKKTT